MALWVSCVCEGTSAVTAPTSRRIIGRARTRAEPTTGAARATSTRSRVNAEAKTRSGSHCGCVGDGMVGNKLPQDSQERRRFRPKLLDSRTVKQPNLAAGKPACTQANGGTDAAYS